MSSLTRFGCPAAAFPCVFGHMRRRHSSHNRASPGAEASVKAARSCAPRSGRSALTDDGAEGTSPRVLRCRPYHLSYSSSVSRVSPRLRFLTSQRTREAGSGSRHDVSHGNAHPPEMKREQKQEQAVTTQREIAPEQEQSYDMGSGL